jgi:MoxR-like ATPase
MSYFRELDALIGVALQSGVVPFLAGPPGTGKSSRVLAVAKALDYHPLTVRPAQVEPADLTGYPVPSVGVDGTPRLSFLTGPVLTEAMRIIDAGGRVLVFLDEVCHANSQQQAPLMGLVFDRRAGALTLPAAPELSWCMAGNPPEAGGSDVGFDLSAALANRVSRVPIDPPPAAEWVSSWQRGWPTPHAPRLDADRYNAELAVARTHVGAFLLARPAHLHAMPKSAEEQGRPWPSPRTWDEATRALAAGRALGERDASLRLVRGLVGDVVTELVTYLTELDLPDPRDVLAGRVPPPTDPQRRDRTRVTLEAVSDLVAANVKAGVAGVDAQVRAAVAVLVAVEAAGLPDLLLKPTKRLVDAVGTNRPAELDALLVRVEPLARKARGV